MFVICGIYSIREILCSITPLQNEKNSQKCGANVGAHGIKGEGGYEFCRGGLGNKCGSPEKGCKKKHQASF